jgi:nucleoside-diphosphate-sugar epimerase
MKALLAGATGAVGRPLTPKLVAAGHDVVALTRSETKFDAIRQLGARPMLADALDPDAVVRAVAEAQPEAIIHELTALSGPFDMRHFDRTFAMTNRLRTEGTDHLLAAGRAVGVRRFVAQSFGGWPYARSGGPIKTEEDPLDPTPPKGMESILAAIRHLEAAVTGAEWTEGIALRYGGFYGPGTSLWHGSEQVEAIRKRRFPVIGDGDGVVSLIHVEDAADATVLALERGRRGIYNVVDDSPVRMADWLPELAAVLGAKRPRRIPRWIGRLIAGEPAVAMMTDARGASNAKAKQELGWQPHYPSWREGFAEVAA